MITNIGKAIRDIEDRQRRPELPPLKVGLKVRVHFTITEGDKSRIQVFEGDIIRIKHGNSARGTFTVRKLSFGVGVERTFPMQSPLIATIEVVREGRTRRAKLYYLRDRVGKYTRLKEVITHRKNEA